MKYKGLTKFFFKKSQSINCGHLKYAIENNLLDISEEANNSEYFGPDVLDEYFSMVEVFENNIDEIPEAIKYFLALKEKVQIFFEKKYLQDLKNSYKNFQIDYEGLFTTLDYINIDKSNQTITWFLISPSTWNEKSYFLDLTKVKKSGRPTSINKPSKIFSEEIKILQGQDLNGKEYYKRIQEANTFSLNKNLSAFSVDGKTLFKNFITLGSFKSTKRDKIYGLLFNLFIINKKYPNYKIITQLPLLTKEYKPSFEFLVNILDPKSKTGKLQIEIMDKMIHNSYEKWNKTSKKFTLPNWSSSYPTIGKKCFVCRIPDLESKIGRDFNTSAIKEDIKNFNGKIAMIDFETINDPLPQPEYYKPYSKIVVQVSIHYMSNGQLEQHKEYLAKNLTKKELEKIYNLVCEAVKKDYKLAAYYAPFERSALREMEKVLKRNDISKIYELRSKEQIDNFIYPQIITKGDKKFYNTKQEIRASSEKSILDLMDFFLKPTQQREHFKISLNRFGHSKSIKKTIELYAGDKNPYKKLNINNGFKAMAELYDIIVDNNKKDIEQRRKELLAYCKQDTLTMVDLYKKILELNNMSKNNREKELEKLDK